MDDETKKRAISALKIKYSGSSNSRRGPRTETQKRALRAETPWIAPLLDANSHVATCVARWPCEWGGVAAHIAAAIDAADAAILRAYADGRPVVVRDNVRRYADDLDTIGGLPGGVHIVAALDDVARNARDTDSWRTVRLALWDARRAALDWLNSAPETGDEEPAAPDETVILELLRADPQFADAVKSLAFDAILRQKKQKNA